MKKVCINVQYGGFGLSDEATELYLTKTGHVPFYKHVESYGANYAFAPFVDGKSEQGLYFSEWDIERDDTSLIEVVEELGDKANGKYATLKIVEIPDDVKWKITEYDGYEAVQECSRSWG